MYGPFPNFITTMTLIIPWFLLFYPITAIVTFFNHHALVMYLMSGYYLPASLQILSGRLQMDLF